MKKGIVNAKKLQSHECKIFRFKTRLYFLSQSLKELLPATFLVTSVYREVDLEITFYRALNSLKFARSDLRY